MVADVEIPHPFTILKKLARALRKSQTKDDETSLDAKEAAGTINTVRAWLACLPPLCCQTPLMRGPGLAVEKQTQERRGGCPMTRLWLEQEDTFGEPLLQDPTKFKCTSQATHLGGM